MDSATKLSNNFVNFASTQSTNYVVIEDKINNVFGIQYHPEVTDTTYGKKVYRNFIRLCDIKVKKKRIIENQLKQIQSNIQKDIPLNETVLIAVSGGVDSTLIFISSLRCSILKI
jgi:GMP synthase (glutamine-hydrolysing)